MLKVCQILQMLPPSKYFHNELEHGIVRFGGFGGAKDSI